MSAHTSFRLAQSMIPNVEIFPRPEASAAAAAADLSVVHVSTTEQRGGAAKCAQRLHRALGAEGVLSRMLVAQKASSDPEVFEYNPLRPAPAALGRAFFRAMRRSHHHPSAGKAGSYFTSDRTPTGWRLASQVRDCDVVNLHFVSDLFDYRALPRLAERFPVVWTFHDMNVFTGGCHYTGACERFCGRCGSCPQLKDSSVERDATRRIWERKSRLFGRMSPERLKIVCPSRWMAREAGRSALCRKFDIRVIPSGIDTHEYRPLDQAEARSRLDLPQGAKIVLFVADAIDDHRKGLSFLLDAFRALRDVPGLLLVMLGGKGAGGMPSGPFFRQLGPWDDSEMLRAAYSAADVFAIPSLQDNMPNTALESMACGTPVAGFAAGGIAEAVVDGQTGLLAPIGDAAGLASGIRRILVDAPLRRTFAGEARARAEREYSSRLQALRYAAFYGEVLQSRDHS